VSGRGGVVEHEIFIDASPETVFRFLVDARLMVHWIGLSHSVDARPGGSFEVEVSRGNVARGTYTEVTPPRRVAFTWGWHSDDPALALTPPGASLVEIELEAKDGGTLVRLRHSQLPEATQPIHRERWALYLNRLHAAGRSTMSS
jgi:uncharacterized protein YndB with AHSA1/START domain